jgi:actin-related protein 8
MIVDTDQTDLSNFLNITERGSDSIVFQFGSHSVKFGLASQLTPFVIPNCIAYRKIEKAEINSHLIQNENQNHKNDSFYVEGGDHMQVDSENSFSRPEITESFLSNLLNIEQETMKKQLKLEQRLKIKKMPNSNKSFIGKNFENSETDIPERKNYEGTPLWSSNLKKTQAMAADLNEDITENNYKWTSISNEPSFLIGREALTINELNKYIIRYPIKYGFFNNEYSFQGVLDDLQKIIEFCVLNILQIKKAQFSNFNIVLIIPDLYVKQQVKGMVNVFLRNLNFRAIFIHTESVMSTFGAAMQSSCVVDIGSSKISVCCTDEGMIIEESLIRKNFGGDDITTLMYMILSRKSGTIANIHSHGRINFPIDYFDINNPYHFRLIEKLKEQECEFPSIQNPSSQFLPKSTKIWLHRRHQTTKLFNVTLTEAIYVPPLSLIYPEIFESFRNVTVPYLNYYNDIYTEVYTDPEDVMDDLIKSLITNEKEKEKAEKAEREGGGKKYLITFFLFYLFF